MLEIKRATPDDAERAFEIRHEAIRGQCIGAYSAEQMALWTRGRASDGYGALMEKQFYMGWFNGKPVVTGMLDLASQSAISSAPSKSANGPTWCCGARLFSASSPR